ncbi:MAG TPA: DUF3618 domain-containing protein [Propionibacteriaceae bacterium]|nr:DUF3618 domain-containing protein [Propionibacteriaceae bacterium]
MSTNDPEEIRREIDATRSSLSYDVNALADEARPRNIARRQVRKVRSSAMSLRERLFGSDDDSEYESGYSQVYDPDYYRAGAPGGWQSGSNAWEPGMYGGQGAEEGGMVQQAREGVGNVAGSVSDTAQNAAHSVADTAQNAAHTVRDTAAQAPRQLKQKTQGAPLTLGLIAFGVGGLVAALLPPSDKERQAAARVKEQAAPLVDEAKSVAQESVQNLKPAAQDAVASVKETAQSGVQEVKQDAQSGAQNVKDQASQAKDDVQNSSGNQPSF